MLKNILYVVLNTIFPIFAFAQSDTTSLFQFSTSDLLALPPDVTDLKVTTASKNAEGLKDATASISVISSYEIEAYGALSLVDVLDRVVGTYITGSYTLTNNIISIRSDVTITHNTHVLVLLNGRPMRENMYHGFNTAIYYAIPLTTIDRIELIRGPGSVLYGASAFAGVVNIILKEGKKQSSNASQTFGSFGTRLTEMAGGYNKNAFKVAGGLRLLDSNGWQFKALGAKNAPIDELATSLAIGGNAHITYKNFTLDLFS